MRKLIAFLLGILIGAALGAALAALLTPESGPALQADLRERMRRGQVARAQAEQATTEALRAKFRAEVKNQDALRPGTPTEGIVTAAPTPKTS
jgi:gas vesicle protein